MSDPTKLVPKETLADRLYAAHVALKTLDNVYDYKEQLLSLCADLQAHLVPPESEATWRSHDGRVWKIGEMSDEHVINSLGVLLRRPDEPMSPMLPLLLAEARKRQDKQPHSKLRRRFRKNFRFLVDQAKYKFDYELPEAEGAPDGSSRIHNEEVPHESQD